MLAALVLATAAFGRPFSKLGVPELHLYVTEVAIVVTVVLAFARCGFRGVLERLRRVGVLIPLLLLWLAGAVATVRGLANYGMGNVVHDVALVEYSVFVPLVAVVVDNETRARLFMHVLVMAGLAATVAFAVVYFVDPFGPLGPLENPSVAVGVYLSLLILTVAALVAHGRKPSPVEIFMAVAALVLLALPATRANIVALVAALAALFILAPRRTTAAVVAGASLAISLLGGALPDVTDIGNRNLPQAAEVARRTDEAGKATAPGRPTGPGESLAEATRETFVEGTPESSNARWRLAYWTYLLAQVPEHPVFGAGFGKPTDFHWHGETYDARNDPSSIFNVTPPHNSFVNLLYRTGLLGALAFVWLVAVAVWRVLSTLRARPQTEERVRLVALSCMFVFMGVAASLSGALEGPFMGIFFWIVLGLLLVLPRLTEAPDGATDRRTAASAD